MAQMGTTPVFACKHCGKPVAITLSTTVDPGAVLLREFMQHLQDIAICPECHKKQLWLQAHGQESEFKVNPRGIIYNVIDNSGMDYYGRKMR